LPVLGSGPGGSFLRELQTAQALLLRWERSGQQISWEAARADVQRTSAFIRRHPRDVLGFALLCEMQQRTFGRTSASGRQRSLALAAEWARLAAANDDAYQARYEQACLLADGGQREEAAAQFKKLYAAALDAGVLPPIDQRFQLALQSLSDKPPLDDW